jgi:hypothetical protein
VTEKEAQQQRKLVRALTAITMHLVKTPGRFLTLEPDIVKSADDLLTKGYKLRIRRGEDDSLVVNLESPNPPKPEDDISIELKNP